MPATFVTPVLIGRQRELEILEQTLPSVQGGSGRCILLAGEAGIGKSRLANELGNRAIAAGFSIMQGYCSEQDISFPYAPWIDMLRTILAGRDAGEVNEILGSFAPELVKLLPELAMMLPSIQPNPALDHTAEKHHLFETVLRFIASQAASHPILIILEDLHWSDEQSLELLHFFVRRINSIPILILGTYRTEDISPRLAAHLAELNRTRLVDVIELSPLAHPEVSRMMQAIMHLDSPISNDWLNMLTSLTEGNPFFVEEITKSLALSGSKPGQWDSKQIPGSIQHIVKSRAELLPERTRRVLSLASVIGERFDFALLQAISEEDEQSLMEILKELIATQLVVEQSADQFAFRHALTQEVIYTSLMLRERKSMHQMIGATIEQRFPAQSDAQAAPLAYHFYQAEDWHKTMAYSLQAGEKALALYAPREALAHFSHSLEAAQQLGIAIPLEALRGRAQARSVLGDFEGARVDYESIIQLARNAEDQYSEWQALFDLGYTWQPRDLERAGEYFRSAMQLARTLGDDLILARSLNRLGTWYFFRSTPDEALPLHHEALEIFERLGDHGGMGATLEYLGMASYGIGDVIRGVANYDQAIPILRELDDRPGLVRALEFLSMRARFDTEVVGEMNLSQLAGYSEQAYEIAHSFDWHEGEGEALSRAAICWNKMGEYGRGLELLQQAQRLGEDIHHRHLLTSVYLLLGELYLGLLDIDQAQHYLELSHSLAQEVGALQLLKSVTPLLVRTYITQHDYQHAETILTQLSLTQDIAKIEAAGAFERLVWSAQAELELATGHSAQALDILDRLISCAKNLADFGPYSIPWLSQLHAQALTALGRLDEAAGELIGAQAIARGWGAKPLLWQLHADLGKVYRMLGRRVDAEREFQSARTLFTEIANRVPGGTLRENFFIQARANIPPERVPTARQSAKTEHGGLTAREREIARLIARGGSNRDIAGELYISEKTVERHVANILAKLGFNARTQIAAWVVSRGFDN